MSATPPPPPAVIGSGKPHTVALKPGSNVATSETARPRGDDASPGLTARLMATLRRGEEASAAKRGASPSQNVAVAPATEETAADTPATTATGLSAAIQQRIAQLRQRNDAVRGEIDRLPPKGRRAR